MKIPGEGLAKGLGVTLQTMTKRSVTAQYPDVQPELPPRSRGVIALLEENCTVCMLCARECPDWCIYIDSHKETIPAPPGGRERARNVLDRFGIDFSLCMYCGICIEVCPFDALFWSPEFEYAEFDIRDLTHEKDRLGEWMGTVPPPPAHDPRGEAPKEVDAAVKALAKAAAPERPVRERPVRERPVRERTAPAAAEPAPGPAPLVDQDDVDAATATPTSPGPRTEGGIEESGGVEEGGARRELGSVVRRPDDSTTGRNGSAPE